jgi:hypothetical protein
MTSADLPVHVPVLNDNGHIAVEHMPDNYSYLLDGRELDESTATLIAEPNSATRNAVGLFGAWGDTWRTADVATFPGYLSMNTGTGLTSGHHTAIRARVRRSGRYTQARFYVFAAGVGVVNGRVAVFDDGGALLASTDNVAADMLATGIKTVPLATPADLTIGQYVYLGIGQQGSTTAPQFARMGALPALVSADGVRRAWNNAAGTPASGAPAPMTGANNNVSVLPWIELLS